MDVTAQETLAFVANDDSPAIVICDDSPFCSWATASS